MSRRGRLLLVCVLVVGLAGAVLWAAASHGETLIRRLVVHQISSALPGPVRIGAVEVDLVPPGVRIRDFAVDDESGALLGRFSEAEAALALGMSLWEGAWIVDLEVAGLEVVIDEQSPVWADRSRGVTPQSGDASAFLPRQLRIRDARLEWRSKEEGTRAAVEGLELEGDLRGILEARVVFEGRGRGWVERRGERLEIVRASTSGEAGTAGVKLEDFRLEGESGWLRGSGAWAAGGIQANVRAGIQLESLLALVPEAGEIRGGAGVDARIDGTLEQPRVRARLTADEVVIEDVAFSGTGELRSHGVEWRLSTASVEIFGGRAEAEATGRFTTEIPYSLKGSFESWVPPRFLSLFDLDVPVRGDWDGTLRLRGHLLGDDLEGEGRFRLHEGSEALEGEAAFEVARDSAEVRGSIGDARGTLLTCHYEVRNGDLGGRAQLEGPGLSTILRFVGLPWDGTGRIEGRFEGTVDDPRLAGTVDLERLEIDGTSLGPVRGPYEISSRSVHSKGFELFGGSLRLTGAYPMAPGEAGRWSVEMAGLPVERVLETWQTMRPGIPGVPASGSIHGALGGQGSFADLKIDGRLRVAELRIGPEGPGEFNGRVQLAPDDWQIDGRLSLEDDFEIGIVVVAAAAGTLSGRVSSSGGRLEGLSLIRDRWPGMKGRFAAQAIVRGTVEEPEISADLAVESVSWRGESLGSAGAEVRLKGTSLTVEASAKDRWSFRASGRLAETFPFQAEGAWTDLDVRPLLAPDSDAEIRLSGRGRLKGSIEQPLGRGNVELEGLSIRREGLVLRSERATRITIDDGRAELGSLTLVNGGQRVTFEGKLGQERSELTARGRGDLGLVETILPDLASARGMLDFDITATQSGSRPWELSGFARVENGAIDLGLLVGVTQVSGEARFEGRSAQIQDLTGRLGGGSFLIAGDVHSDTGWDLGWAVRDASFGVPEWLDYRASGNGRFAGLFARPRLTGDVEITQALYDRRVDWAEFLPWFRREAQRSHAGADLPVELDLSVFGSGGIFIDNNLVEAELEARFNVRGGGESVRWAGRLDVIDGRFTFRRRSFSITAGTVQFHERRPLNPDLEFQGETTVTTTDGDYEIVVHVGGTAENPRIEFTADDPTLTENDILALVTFGRTVSQLQAQGAGIELSEVLALTAGPRAGDVEERIYDVLLVDRIEIQPSFSRTTGATEPRLSIGKDLTEGLRALLSTGLGSERQQDVALEYQLTPRVAVQGIWESQTKSQAGAFGGDVLFRYSFRTFRQFSLLPGGEERSR